MSRNYSNALYVGELIMSIKNKMTDRNGKELKIGDIVKLRKDKDGDNFNRIGKIVDSHINEYGEYFLDVYYYADNIGMCGKFPINVEFLSDEEAMLFLLER